MIKDFIWWLTKENIVVNIIYRNYIYLLFPKKEDFKLEGVALTSKDELVSNNTKSLKRNLLSIKGYTSGTTNKPMTVYRSLKSILLEEYIIKSLLKQVGVSVRPRIAIIRGDKINHATKNSGPFWKEMKFTKRLILSSYHISESNAQAYFDELTRYKPEVIFAYPSSITLLAKYALKLDWKPNWEVKAVITSSETFKLQDQVLAKKVFCNIFDHYGQAERVAVLQQCIHGNYHVRDDYSKVEFIADEHGLSIIGSNYHNKAMPLKRYNTKDYVIGLHQDASCLCGNRADYVEQVLGRDDDFVILSDGRQIGRLDVVFKEVKGLVECQVEQVSLTEIIIRLVPTLDCNIDTLKQTLHDNLEERLGVGFNFNYQIVNEVPRTKAGKFRSVIRNKELKVA